MVVEVMLSMEYQHSKLLVKENVACGAVDSQDLTSKNGACETNANEVPTSENVSTTKINDDGPVNQLKFNDDHLY